MSQNFFAPSDSTRVSSNSPTWSSSSFDSTSTIPNSTAPLTLFSNDFHYNSSRAFGASNNVAYTGELFGSPPAATQPAVEATGRRSPSPPTVQLHNLFLSSPPPDAPCGPVTFVPTSAVVAPQPVSSSPPSIGGAWPAELRPPPVLANASPSGSPPPPPPDTPPARPQMQAKIPPEKGRKRFDCCEPRCGMTFSKKNALVQHMRSHTGERPEVCHYCNRRFSLRCNLRRHYKTCKEKKALDKLAAGIKQGPPSSPGSSGQSTSSSASSPLSLTAIASSLDSPPGDLLIAAPLFWDPGFSIDPSQQLDMTYGNRLFSPQLTDLNPCPPLVQARF